MSGIASYRLNAAALARAANHLAAAAPRRAPFTLAFLTDHKRADAETIARALPAGAAVILRDYDLPPRIRRGLATRLRTITAARGVFLLIAGDAGLAAAIGADGVHYSASRLKATDQRPEGFKIVTAACHDADELSAAARFADLALLSPVFATASHPGAPHLGVARFAGLVALARVPVLALGGVNQENARLLRKTGAAGLAAIGAFAGH